MKKAINTEEIKPVNFSGGLRGKHSASYRRGHSIKNRHDDGTVTVQRFVPDHNAVVLDLDVKAYFPNAAAVNNALRALISILPHKRKRTSAGRSNKGGAPV